jgi:hypothetical protein
MELLDAESVVEEAPTTYWSVRSDQTVVGRRTWYPSTISRQQPSIWLFDWQETCRQTSLWAADVRTLTNAGDPMGAAREFRIEDLRVGEILARGGQIVSFDEFIRVPGTRADPARTLVPARAPPLWIRRQSSTFTERVTHRNGRDLVDRPRYDSEK